MTATYDVDGLVAVVTGGASGIGAATCRLLSDNGATVAVLDVNGEAAVSVAASLTGEARGFAVDVADSAAVRGAMGDVVRAFGRIDIAVNNAAIARHGAVADLSDEVWREVLAIDLDGVFYCMKAQIDAMLRTGGGSIVNLASTVGFVAIKGLSAYLAAKHGVVGLTRIGAVDYARSGIRVNAVAPGRIETPQLLADVTPEVTIEDLADRCPMGRLGDPDEVAHVIAFLASRASSFMTGAVVSVDGGYLAGAGR